MFLQLFCSSSHFCKLVTSLKDYICFSELHVLFTKYRKLQIKLDLLSTACTAERREKSHCKDAGKQQTRWCGCFKEGLMGLHDTDSKTALETQIIKLFLQNNRISHHRGLSLVCSRERALKESERILMQPQTHGTRFSTLVQTEGRWRSVISVFM